MILMSFSNQNFSSPLWSSAHRFSKLAPSEELKINIEVDATTFCSDKNYESDTWHCD